MLSSGNLQSSPFSAPSGLPPGVPGAQGEPAVKEAEGIPEVPSLSCGETLLSSSAITPIRKGVGHENHLFGPIFRQDIRKVTG